MRPLVLLLVLALLVPATGARARTPLLEPPRVDSPRATIQSLFDEVERTFATRSVDAGLTLKAMLSERMLALLDLEGLPAQLRGDFGVDTGLMLYEVLSRLEQLPLEEMPDRAEADEAQLDRWVVPGTGISLERHRDRASGDAFLFTTPTLFAINAAYDALAAEPKRRGALPFDTFEAYRDGVGPWLTRLMNEQNGLITPDWARHQILRVPAWKMAAAALVHLATLAAAAAAYWAIRARRPGRESHLRASARGLALPLLLMVAAVWLQFSVDGELRITGPVLAVLSVLWTTIFTVGAVLFALTTLDLAADLFLAIGGKGNEEQTVRLVFRVFAIIIAIGIVVVALQRLGVPVSGIVTGLGVGGIALGFAAQGLLQSVLAGAAILTDRPFRVGDFCRFGERLGTVETLSLRSARIRALDRTLVTIPNASLAAMHIENFTRRDQILLQADLLLRLDTTPDQLRAVLADIRALLIAHPRIAADPARARFTGVTDTALAIEIFAFARSTDWNEFLAIREDIMLRIMDVIARNGCMFAVPVQSIRFGREEAPDADGRRHAEEKVARWRRANRLPFPEFEVGQRGELTNTLAYPPEGSPDAVRG